MNLGLYESLVHWSELTGCTMDDALTYAALALFIFIALLSFAVEIAADCGSILCRCAKKLFRFICCKVKGEPQTAEEP